MYIKVKKQNHFFNLLEGSTLTVAHFYNKDIGEFNNQRLMELQNNHKKAIEKYNEISSIAFSIVSFLGSKNSAYYLRLLEEERSRMVSSAYELDTFESDLAYLLLSGIISFEECESLGFDNDYIRNLLEEYKKQVENPYVEYYYNEKTNRVSKYTEDARLLDLPYIPHEVKKIIEKENETKLDLNDDEKPKQYRRV